MGGKGGRNVNKCAGNKGLESVHATLHTLWLTTEFKNERLITLKR